MYVNNLHFYKVCTFLCILCISVTENSPKTSPPQAQAAVKHAVGVCKHVTGVISYSFKRRRDLVVTLACPPTSSRVRPPPDGAHGNR